jgi:hypothetical protein
MAIRERATAATAVALTAVLLAGCTPSADEVKQARQAQGTASTGGNLQPPAPAIPGRTDAELVNAVVSDATVSSADAGFELKFRLLSRPEVSRPVQLELVAVPAASRKLLYLQLAVQAGEGLQLQGSATFEDRDVPADTVVRHLLTLVPQATGVLQLHVTAAATTDKANSSRKFAIPLIATAAVPAAPGA